MADRINPPGKTNASAADPWFRVEVSDGNGQIVAIEPEMLAGRAIGPAEKTTIRRAIAHLSGFVGPVEATTGAPDDRDGRLLSVYEVVLNKLMDDAQDSPEPVSRSSAYADALDRLREMGNADLLEHISNAIEQQYVR